MKKDLGVLEAVFPMPVLMIAAYDENGTVNVMNAAWGQICDYKQIALFLDEAHKTTENILKTKAFTVALADRAHMTEADYVGIVSGHKVPDKFARSGLTAVKSAHVNAPIIEEFPVVMECELADVVKKGSLFGVIGRIVNTAADEKVLDAQGKVDVTKLNALIFDTFRHDYYVCGEKAGQAFREGAALKGKK
ncbi:MAG: flavin reductase family protein [Acidaminococcaceae bacterium]|nr:flavin reductase family protein [Acidaminococcaceae bacterium]